MDIFLDKGTMEFLAVASEYCAFIEKAQKFGRSEFVVKLQKMLSLVYLKTALLAADNDSRDELDGEAEAFLSEYEYEYIRGIVSRKLGSYDSYINIYNSAQNDSGYEQAEISDCVADVYHNLKNFVENCRTASEESALASRTELISDFKEYWGYRALALVAALHAIVYGGVSDEDDDEDAGDKRSGSANSLLDRYMDEYRKDTGF